MNHREQYAMDTLTNAIECGISYWAVGRKFKTTKDGLYTSCEIRPNPDEGLPFDKGDKRNGWQELNTEKILAACDLILSDAGAKLCAHRIRAEILGDISDNGCRSDADTADVIVQVALFGELVFG